MKYYGKELILDLHECNTEKFNRKDLKRFFKELCELINMEPCKLVFWDYLWSRKPKNLAPHLDGTSAVQFISTSNVTIHTLDQLKDVYINIFSCKDFDPDKASNFCIKYFEGVLVHKRVIDRI